METRNLKVRRPAEVQTRGWYKKARIYPTIKRKAEKSLGVTPGNFQTGANIAVSGSIQIVDLNGIRNCQSHVRWRCLAGRIDCFRWNAADGKILAETADDYSILSITSQSYWKSLLENFIIVTQRYLVTNTSMRQ